MPERARRAARGGRGQARGDGAAGTGNAGVFVTLGMQASFRPGAAVRGAVTREDAPDRPGWQEDGGSSGAGYPGQMDATELGRVRVTALDGKRAALSALWARRAVVLVFVRHFG